ncbi:MAG TPA: carbohydrate-binding family 9-like protein [Bacteroidota bacterium]|nr:carbohydrate-binding family 9-like protein [Bacteroidota bacterium]
MKGLHLVTILLLLGPASPRLHTAPPVPHPKGYVCPFTPRPVVIDGVIDEREWHDAPWTGNFVDIEGDLRPLPRFRTRVRMLWDSTYLYIGAELREPNVWGTLTKRDTVIFNDDDFEVFIDPNGDNHEYYEMEMNALNTVWDLFLDRPYRDGGKPRDGWDIAGLKTAVRVHGTLNNPADVDTGWTVEIAMPWKALGEYAHRTVPPSPGDQWRINFSRVEWRVDTTGGVSRRVPGTKEDNWVWSPQWVVDMHQPEMWGYLQFGGPGARQSAFRHDPSRPAEEALMAVYRAQIEFRKAHGRWAASRGELTLLQKETYPFETPPAISLTGAGYIASVTIRLPGGKKVSWFVTEDSRLWHQ